MIEAILTILIIAGIIIAVKKSGPGCSGDCNQGRSPCNCRGEVNGK